jgi:hypothetical protein
MAPGSMLFKADEPDLDDACKTEFQEMLGELLYLSTRTRPDLAFAAGKLSQAMAKPTAVHYQAVKRVMRYLKGTWDYGLFYSLQEAVAV